ncbi:hypothetical protein FGRMN_1844 [Fusarium graminum]|nr:hypothetical protein FGRMN_1844 [Fusarium graminum]
MQDRKHHRDEATMPSTTLAKRPCIENETPCSSQKDQEEILDQEACELAEEALPEPEDEWVAPLTLEIVESGEVWKGPGPDEDFEHYYDHTFAVVRISTEDHFHVKFVKRVNINEFKRIDMRQLDLTSVAFDDIPLEFALFLAKGFKFDPELIRWTLIPGKHIWPRFSSSLTAAPEKILQYCFVKHAKVCNYDPEQKGRNIKNIVLAEAEIGELLMDHHHPNIARYWGCDVVDGRIRGLCYGKYVMTLSERAESGVPLDVEYCLQGIRDGLDHLHGLGLAHNDINPNNIMLDAGDNPVIIDFDSCKPEGEHLLKRGTPNWSIESSRTSSRENDFYGLRKIEEYFANGMEEENQDLDQE